jgi:hypothetical protein
MFDGVTGMDWLFLVAALALGFGVVKFMMVAHAVPKAAVPAVTIGSVPVQAPKAHGVECAHAFDGAGVNGATSEESAESRPAWFELLGVPQRASEHEIEHAFQKQWFAADPARVNRLMADLCFIADGGLEAAGPQQLAARSMKASMTAQQLKLMVFNFVRDMEGARQEGLARRRQGLVD